MANTYVSDPNTDFSYFLILKYCANSSVGIATNYGLGGWGKIPGRGKRFFSTPQRVVTT
jgi:hypothetical protein